MAWKICGACGEKYWHPAAGDCPPAAQLIEEGAKGECPNCGAPIENEPKPKEGVELQEIKDEFAKLFPDITKDLKRLDEQEEYHRGSAEGIWYGFKAGYTRGKGEPFERVREEDK